MSTHAGAALVSSRLVAGRLLTKKDAGLGAFTLKAQREGPIFYPRMLPDAAGFNYESNATGDKVVTRLDNCGCAECINPVTRQRSFDILAHSRLVEPRQVLPSVDGFEVLWSDRHRSKYTWNWLQSAMPGGKHPFSGDVVQRLWNRRLIYEEPPEVKFKSVMRTDSLQGIAELTNKIREHGFCFVVNTPVTPEDTQSLLERIGPIRNTHYGGFWDFTPNMAKADMAYSNAALDVHTDTTYFSDPAGLQAFHLLSHTGPNGEEMRLHERGGQSILVDGFYAAHRLRLERRDHYETLQTVNLPWHASGNQDVAMAPARPYPVIEGHGKTVFRIRWNKDDRGSLPLKVNTKWWYNAAREWDTIVNRQENQYEFLLEPGRVLIFDNWRILHGRREFWGLRRICGGYINRDDFISRWKLSNFPREEVIAANMIAA
ncbi:taurine catabolism dioxygenase tauD, tfdA family protein [Hirsutella rhossiliensis]|uniref:trimethyllysine dioxygenase n=1 Tax=Hirsutella rhossiliensis TaxID=111463 RepID=A0A9P8SJS1_9HYPO|nr:taurine catabolism dioxygenase tauD, tfdA family domain-containing protein [Hirsutella rhossiliensis]KAH0965206.1 taurine catabolism dioxygenase tauD, tfdA family domain-containing protein [Hirsutella rhossiliensis]